MSSTTLNTMVEPNSKPIPTPTTERPPVLSESNNENPLSDSKLEAQNDAHGQDPLASLSSVRKHILLIVFAIATFVDVCKSFSPVPGIATNGYRQCLRRRYRRSRYRS